MRIAYVLAVATVVGLAATTAFGAFDGENGKIAFASDSHGAGLRHLGDESGRRPGWSI